MCVRQPDVNVPRNLDLAEPVGLSNAPVSTAGRRRECRRPDYQRLAPVTTLALLPALVVLSRLMVPTVVTDADDRILFVNPAFADMVGGADTVLHDTTLQDICRTADAGAAVRHLAGKARRSDMVTLQHADGWPVYASVTGETITSHGHDFKISVFTDVSDQLWEHQRAH